MITRMPDWFPLGDYDLLVVSDGVLRLDAGSVFGVTPRVMWEPLVEPLDEEYSLPVGLNCLLVRSQDKLILVETGVGNKTVRVPRGSGVAQAGTLLEDMARQGIRPEDVDIVINTHLHFDHCGGNTTYRDGKLALTFPRARYFLQKGEWEEANHSNERTRASYLPENLEPLADSDQLELVDGEAEVVIPLQEKLLDAAGSVHGSVLHRAMSDAALFAASSVVPKELVASTSFDIQVSRTVAEGQLIARGRLIDCSEEHCLAEAVVVDSEGMELGRGTGTFVKTEIPLSADLGYE